MSARIGLAALFFAVILILLALASTLSPLARLAPLWVLLPTAVLAALQLLNEVRERPAAAIAPSGEVRGRQLRITAWLVGLSGLVFLIGFLAAATLFLLLFLRVEAVWGWKGSLLLTAGIIGVVYLVFGVLGGVSLSGGVIF